MEKDLDLKAIAGYYEIEDYSMVEVLKPYKKLVDEISEGEENKKELFWIILCYINAKVQPPEEDKNYEKFLIIKEAIDYK